MKLNFNDYQDFRKHNRQLTFTNFYHKTRKLVQYILISEVGGGLFLDLPLLAFQPLFIKIKSTFIIIES